MHRMIDIGSRKSSPVLAAVLAAACLIAGSGEARAQETDGRWLPFSGCWEPVGESVSAEAPEAQVCFRGVEGDVGVELVSLENGEIVAREALQADGNWRDAGADGCTGRQLTDFSARPGRVYLRSEHDCEGGVTQSSTGMLAFVSSREWIDVRVVSAGVENFVWFTRYQVATTSDEGGVDDIAAGRGMAANSARMAAAARPTVDDVIEAAGYVDDEGVKTWLAERDAWLESLESDDLLRLADAGVSEDVIDMAIAVSYPERFAIDRDDVLGYGGFASSGPGYAPFYDRYYSPYRYGYGYGYGFGYGYGGRYRGPIIVVVSPDERASGGRVISGQGYSQGARATPTRSSASPRSSGASGSSIGRSSGSSGTSTGRTARRRSGGS
jgi:hypothetical protein